MDHGIRLRNDSTMKEKTQQPNIWSPFQKEQSILRSLSPVQHNCIQLISTLK